MSTTVNLKLPQETQKEGTENFLKSETLGHCASPRPVSYPRMHSRHPMIHNQMPLKAREFLKDGGSQESGTWGVAGTAQNSVYFRHLVSSQPAEQATSCLFLLETRSFFLGKR